MSFTGHVRYAIEKIQRELMDSVDALHIVILVVLSMAGFLSVHKRLAEKREFKLFPFDDGEIRKWVSSMQNGVAFNF